MSVGVRLQAVSKSFVDKTQGSLRPALRDVSLRVEPGEFVALVGPSGCGKSTILRMLADLEVPDDGRVLLDQKAPDEFSGRLGYIFQEARLVGWQSVSTNVELAVSAAARSNGGSSAEIAEQALRDVGLESYCDNYPTTLSGGQRQRVAIARCFAIDPDVILMDEPFSAVDELTARNLRRLLVRMWESRPRTCVYVTHNLREAVMLGDRVVLFSAAPGRVIQEVPINLPRPRDEDDEAVYRLGLELTRELESSTVTEQAGPTPSDPQGVVG